MGMIVPLIFLLFIVPGIVHGYVSGNFGNSQDVIGAMTKSMEGMAYYMVMAFFCALFIKAFGDSQLGTLISSWPVWNCQAVLPWSELFFWSPLSTYL